jgi:hypothetical protein
VVRITDDTHKKRPHQITVADFIIHLPFQFHLASRDFPRIGVILILTYKDFFTHTYIFNKPTISKIPDNNDGIQARNGAPCFGICP